MAEVQKIENVKILNDIFIEFGPSRPEVASALSDAFGINYENVFFEDQNTRDWSSGPESAFLYEYSEGGIKWRVDAFADRNLIIEKALKKLSLLLDIPVYYDRLSKQYESRVDAYFPTGETREALLIEAEDRHGDPIFYVRAVQASTT